MGAVILFTNEVTDVLGFKYLPFRGLPSTVLNLQTVENIYSPHFLLFTCLLPLFSTPCGMALAKGGPEGHNITIILLTIFFWLQFSLCHQPLGARAPGSGGSPGHRAPAHDLFLAAVYSLPELTLSRP